MKRQRSPTLSFSALTPRVRFVRVPKHVLLIPKLICTIKCGGVRYAKSKSKSTPTIVGFQSNETNDENHARLRPTSFKHCEQKEHQVIKANNFIFIFSNFFFAIFKKPMAYYYSLALVPCRNVVKLNFFM